MGWADGFTEGLYNANARIGRISFITWEYNARPGEEYEDRTLDAITDGVYDEYLTNWAQRVAAFDKPIFLRWGHEMNGDWYLWGGANNGGGRLDGYGDPEKPDGPERYVDAYRYICDTFAANGADNVLWVWCPTAPFLTMAALNKGSSQANLHLRARRPEEAALVSFPLRFQHRLFTAVRC